MPKTKKAKLEDKEEAIEEVEVVEEVETKEPEYPEVSRNGRFQSVQVGESFAVYNPDGCRVSGLLNATQANDIVRQQNQAAQIKG